MLGWFSGSICSRVRAVRAVVIACVALGGCVSSIPVPTTIDCTWAQQRWPDATTASLSAGRGLYVDKCSGCHALYVPATIGAARWPAMLDEMTQRAHLRPDQRELILRYLVTASRGSDAAAL